MRRVLSLIMSLVLLISCGIVYAVPVEITDRALGSNDIVDSELKYYDLKEEIYGENKESTIGGSGSVTRGNNGEHFSLMVYIGYGSAEEYFNGRATGGKLYTPEYYGMNVCNVGEDVEITSVKGYYIEKGTYTTPDDYFNQSRLYKGNLGYEEYIEFDLDKLDKIQIRNITSDKMYRTRTVGTTIACTVVVAGMVDGTDFETSVECNAIMLREPQKLISIYSDFSDWFRPVVHN